MALKYNTKAIEQRNYTHTIVKKKEKDTWETPGKFCVEFTRRATFFLRDK